MDYLQLTSPCGLDCFNCVFHLATREDEPALRATRAYHERTGVPLEAIRCLGCLGCRAHGGQPPLHQHFLNRSEPCPAFACSSQRGLNFCYECDDFPCEHLQPYADRAGKLPHNTKVFNLCLIKKMGLEQWAEQMADKVRQAYFHKPWSL